MPVQLPITDDKPYRLFAHLDKVTSWWDPQGCAEAEHKISLLGLLLGRRQSPLLQTISKVDDRVWQITLTALQHQDTFPTTAMLRPLRPNEHSNRICLMLCCTLSKWDTLQVNHWAKVCMWEDSMWWFTTYSLATNEASRILFNGTVRLMEGVNCAMYLYSAWLTLLHAVLYKAAWPLTTQIIHKHWRVMN